MRQTSRPERTRSLPNGDLDLRDVDLSSNVPVEFLRGGGLKEKGQGFRQVRACFGNGVSLACDIYFGAQGDISIALPFNDCGQLASHCTLILSPPSCGRTLSAERCIDGPPAAGSGYRPDPLSPTADIDRTSRHRPWISTGPPAAGPRYRPDPPPLTRDIDRPPAADPRYRPDLPSPTADIDRTPCR